MKKWKTWSKKIIIAALKILNIIFFDDDLRYQFFKKLYPSRWRLFRQTKKCNKKNRDAARRHEQRHQMMRQKLWTKKCDFRGIETIVIKKVEKWLLTKCHLFVIIITVIALSDIKKSFYKQRKSDKEIAFFVLGLKEGRPWNKKKKYYGSHHLSWQKPKSTNS